MPGRSVVGGHGAGGDQDHPWRCGTVGCPWAPDGDARAEGAGAARRIVRCRRDPPRSGKVQYACVADGAAAATGASMGKLNLHLEAAGEADVRTTFRNRKTGASITLAPTEDFITRFKDVPRERLEAAGREVLTIPDAELFLRERARLPPRDLLLGNRDPPQSPRRVDTGAGPHQVKPVLGRCGQTRERLERLGDPALQCVHPGPVPRHARPQPVDCRHPPAPSPPNPWSRDPNPTPRDTEPRVLRGKPGVRTPHTCGPSGSIRA